jgi:hypothetical protein
VHLRVGYNRCDQSRPQALDTGIRTDEGNYVQEPTTTARVCDNFSFMAPDDDRFRADDAASVHELTPACLQIIHADQHSICRLSSWNRNLRRASDKWSDDRTNAIGSDNHVRGESLPVQEFDDAGAGILWYMLDDTPNVEMNGAYHMSHFAVKQDLTRSTESFIRGCSSE